MSSDPAAIRAREDLLIQKLENIEAAFAEFRADRLADQLEYAKRASRFKITLTCMGLVIALIATLGLYGYRFIDCQTRFNDLTQRAQALRSAAAQDYTTATLAYGQVRLDPSSTFEQTQGARQRYYDALRRQAQTQLENPIQYSSNCRL